MDIQKHTTSVNIKKYTISVNTTSVDIVHHFGGYSKMRYINQIKKQVTHVESLAGAVNLAI